MWCPQLTCTLKFRCMLIIMARFTFRTFTIGCRVQVICWDWFRWWLWHSAIIHPCIQNQRRLHIHVNRSCHNLAAVDHRINTTHRSHSSQRTFHHIRVRTFKDILHTNWTLVQTIHHTLQEGSQACPITCKLDSTHRLLKIPAPEQSQKNTSRHL